MKSVFISYARDDEAFARKLRAFLSLEEVEVIGLMDPADIAAGSAIATVVKEGISKAIALVVLVSEKALQSQWVQFEIGAGYAMGKKIIPVLIGQGADKMIPEWLRDLRFIDARNQSDEMVAAEILQAIQAHR